MKKYYIKTDYGCGIRSGNSIVDVKRKVRQEVGTHGGKIEARLATEKDIEWVKGMGGAV